MKKYVLFALSLILALSLFGCQKKYETDIWDGSVAESFEGGKGTKDSPYTIAKASQLAYLAKSVNDGNSFEGKYISLLCDIDLNNIEWTPIGNGKNAFEGFFDGNKCTIKNLNISNTTKYSYKSEDSISYRGFSGLFGFCQNSTMSNLNINYASVCINNANEFSSLNIGILVANVEAKSHIKIDNIKIDTASITIDNSKTTNSAAGIKSMYIGGLAGQIRNDESSKTNINNIQCNDVSVLYGENYQNQNYIGGIIGYVHSNSDFECSNFVGHLITQAPPHLFENFYFGAIGHFYRKNGHINLSNGFSKLSIDKKDQGDYGLPHEHQINAIIGKEIGSLKEDVYNFENLFGYVETTKNNITEKTYNLYSVIKTSKKINEKNCLGCETLPENHGLDTKIWDLSNPAKPKLK